jgi:hypothetical protein
MCLLFYHRGWRKKTWKAGHKKKLANVYNKTIFTLWEVMDATALEF